MIPVWAGIAGMLLALAALLGAVRFYQRRFSPEPEIPRKAMHVLMGLLTLTFPWVFTQRWPVVLLGVLATVAMLALRLIGPLRRGVGDVLHAVDRESLGEICFPISITIVWWFAFGRPLLFVVPVLLLTLADTVAAIVGLRHGHRPYSTAEAPKTVEGSAAFFVTAFATVFIPVYLFAGTGWEKALIIATLVGILVTLFEAIAWRGLDNLFIPLGAYCFLSVQLVEPIEWLIGQLIALLALVAVGIWYRRRTTLADNGALAAALVGYVFWALGGWRWIVAPVTLFLFYAVLTPLPEPHQQQRVHDMRSVMSYCAAGMWWIFVAYSAPRPELLYAFTASFAAQLAMYSFYRIRLRRPHWEARGELGITVLRDWAVMFVPWTLIVGVSQRSTTLAAIGILTTAVAAVGLYAIEEAADGELRTGVRWFSQAVMAFAVSGASVLALGMVKP